MQNRISRRKAAKLIGTAAASALLPIGTSRLLAADTSRILKAIPSTGEKLPVIGLGSAVTFDIRGSAQEAMVREVIALFVKLGGKLIDTSPAYGNAESVIGDVAYKAGLTKSLFFATKVWTRSKPEGIAQMVRSLQRFRTRTIDLVQVHNLADVDREMGALNEFKAKGKIRYTGMTHSERKGHGEMERAMKVNKPDFIQINYSLMDRAAAQRILPMARDMGIAVIINRPFGGGGIFQVISQKPLPTWAAEFDCHSWAQFLLKWIVSHPAITCTIPATNSVKHLEDNMGANVGRLPDAKTRDRMASLFVGF
ncbi:MAG: aldo/keto reductase [Verrucomicrobiota bacterium]|nr:aldo/keto reductase [Verrucomicrobiota bacterium]